MRCGDIIQPTFPRLCIGSGSDLVTYILESTYLSTITRIIDGVALGKNVRSIDTFRVISIVDGYRVLAVRLRYTVVQPVFLAIIIQTTIHAFPNTLTI